MRKAAYKFGYGLGLIGSYFLIIVCSPVLAAISCGVMCLSFVPCVWYLPRLHGA